MPRLQLESASCSLDWLLAAVGAAPTEQVRWQDGRGGITGEGVGAGAQEAIPAGEGTGGTGPLFEVTTYTRAASDEWEIPPAVRPERAEALARIALLEPLPADEPMDGIEEARHRIASLCDGYPARALTGIPGRLPVGELKRRWDASTDPDERAPKTRRAIEPPRPTFVTEKAVSDPTVRGSATHRFLQLVDLSRPCSADDLRQQLAGLRDQGRIAPGDAESVLVESAAWFFSTPLGQRIRAGAADIHREVAFDARIDPQLYDPRIAGHDHRDTILVRGVVDLILDAPGGIEIVDYKTDMLSPAACEARIDAYRPQLDIYALAMEAAFRRQVAHRWLVFLHGQVIADRPPIDELQGPFPRAFSIKIHIR